jgi:hypothetical protein
MSWVAAAIGGAAILGYAGASKQASAATAAANTQAQAAQSAQNQLQTNFQNLSPNYQPYLQTGQAGLNQLNAEMPNLTQTFGPDQLKSNLAPNYQFMLNQGLGAQNQALNASGGGSNIGTAGTKFAEDYASNAYQNAFNNYQAQQTNIYNRLSGIAGIGQNAVSGLSNLATGNATNIANLGVGSANAVAQGQVGSAAAQAQGLNSIGQGVTLASILNPANAGGTNISGPNGISNYFNNNTSATPSWWNSQG